MTALTQSIIPSDIGTDDRVFRKVFRRLMWFLFLLLVVSAFASLTMNKDLASTNVLPLFIAARFVFLVRKSGSIRRLARAYHFCPSRNIGCRLRRERPARFW